MKHWTKFFFRFVKYFLFFEKRERYYVNAFITFYLSSHLFIFSMRVKIDLICIRDKKKKYQFLSYIFFFFFLEIYSYLNQRIDLISI